MKTVLPVIVFFAFIVNGCSNDVQQNHQSVNQSIIAEARERGDLIQGEVIGVSDGDTFRMLVGEKMTIRVRLYGVDAPERGQDYSTQAKQQLSDLVFGKQADVVQKSKDRYGRIVGIAYVNGINVNEALLINGYVWHYTAYDKNEAWKALEQKARTKKAGLWKGVNPTPPWQWRKEMRTDRKLAD